MGKKKTETREYRITGNKKTLAKFERLLALLHFNPSTSGVFGINIKRDSDDVLQVEPVPPKEFQAHVEEICGVGQGAVIADRLWFESRPLDQYKPHWEVDGFGIKRVNPPARKHPGRG